MKGEHEENEKLRERIRQLEATLDSIGAYVYTKDVEGRYTFANKKVCDFFGLPQKEVLGKKDDSFFDLEKSNELTNYDKRVLLEGEHIEAEESDYIKKEDRIRTFWVVKTPIYDETGKITGMCGISTDISERLRMERELKNFNSLLNSILHNAPSMIFMKDFNLKYTYVNHNFTRFFGMKQEEIIGKRDTDFMTPEIAAGVNSIDREVLTTGKKLSGEEILYGANGLASYYWYTKIPLIKNGVPYAIVGISYDVTDRTLLRRQLEDQNEELTSLLEQKNLFLGTVMHDLRNPIGAILGISEILEEKVRRDLIELPKLISEVSSGMLDLVNNLLDVSEIESGKLTLQRSMIDYVRFVNQNITMNEYLANKKDILIKKEIMADKMEVFIDKGKIDQVLNNLIGNAIKYSATGTTIRVVVFSEGNQLITQVCDQGQGIPKEEIAGIFNYFHRSSVKPTGNEKSHGLGLAIVKKIIEGHNGVISVQSQPGEGSVFQFAIPLDNTIGGK